jgi:predicted alpha/beta superfamily hydrolase
MKTGNFSNRREKMIIRTHSLKIMGPILFVLFAGLLLFTNSTSLQEHGDEFVIGKYLKVNSKILNEERTIVVNLPRGYEKAQNSYPVLYFLDAEWEDLVPTVVASTGYLNEFGHIPKMIVVGICNTDRTRDMTPVKIEEEQTSGGADLFLRFISEELMPFIEKNYRTEPFSILFGGSYAGLFTVNAFLEQPENFKAYIASSPGIGVCPDYLYEKADRLFKNTKSLSRFLYMVYGERDYPLSVGHTEDFYDLISANAPEDLESQMELIENEGHVPFIGLYNGLRFIFSDWEFPEDRRAEAGLDEIKQHFGRIAKKYGYEVVIPADLLIGLGYWSTRKEKLEEAIEALLLACELHPYSPDAFYYLGEAYEKKGQIELALKNYKKALKVDPNYLLAIQRIQSLGKERPFVLERSPQTFDPVWSFQPKLGDLDSDGDLDVVLPNMGKNHSQVLFNNGKGIFKDSGIDLGDGVKNGGGYVVGIADKDGDGDLDVFVSNFRTGPNEIWFNLQGDDR